MLRRSLEKTTIGVPHWDSKATIYEYLNASGIPRSLLVYGYVARRLSTHLVLKRVHRILFSELP